MRAAILYGMSLLCSACAPWPHYEQHTPPIHGVVTFKGQPVAGARVSVTVTEVIGDHFTGHEESVTDVQGRFALLPIREFHLFIFVAIGDHFSHSPLTVTAAGKTYPGPSDVGFLSHGPVEIDCELAAPIPGLQQERFCTVDFGSPARDGLDVHALLKQSEFVTMEKLVGSDYRPLYRIEICPTNGCDAFESTSSQLLDDYVYLYSVYVGRYPDFATTGQGSQLHPMAYITEAEKSGYAQRVLGWHSFKLGCTGAADLAACVLAGLRRQGAVKHYDVNYDEGQRTQTLVTEDDAP